MVRTSDVGFGTLAQRPDSHDVCEGYRYVATDTGLTYRAARVRWDVLPVPGTAKVALADADTPGGILAWQNLAGFDLVTFDVRVLVIVAPTTAGGNNIALLGVADDATSEGTAFGTPIALDQSPVPAVVIGNARTLVRAGKYVTLSNQDDDGGSAEDLVGFAYISFIPA